MTHTAPVANLSAVPRPTQCSQCCACCVVYNSRRRTSQPHKVVKAVPTETRLSRKARLSPTAKTQPLEPVSITTGRLDGGQGRLLNQRPEDCSKVLNANRVVQSHKEAHSFRQKVRHRQQSGVVYDIEHFSKRSVASCLCSVFGSSRPRCHLFKAVFCFTVSDVAFCPSRTC